MDISDVRVKLVRDPGERLKAVCTVTFDELFVVRDVKVVDGANGLFVAMPSQKLAVHCPQCHQKNHVRAKFCNECGGKLPPNTVPPDSNGRSRLHRDIAHPIKASFRQAMQERVIEAYNEEAGRAESPDYRPTEEELDGEESDLTPAPAPAPEERGSDYDDIIAELRGRPSPTEPPREQPPRNDRRSGRGPAREHTAPPPRPQEPVFARNNDRAGAEPAVPARKSEAYEQRRKDEPAAPVKRPPPSAPGPVVRESPKPEKTESGSLPFGHGIL